MIDPKPGADELSKAAALIRSCFDKDPYALSDEEFAQYLSEALWLKKFEQQLFENTLLEALKKAFAASR